MTKMVLTAATELANRTSRRGFLARSGKLALGVVGVSTLALLTAETARAGCTNCPNPCLYFTNCSCSPYYRFYYMCPSCTYTVCLYSTCTNIGCY
jgi:hypothetical protein